MSAWLMLADALNEGALGVCDLLDAVLATAQVSR